MAINDELRDLQIRHYVGIQRLGAGVIRRVVALLDEADADIVAQLIRRGQALAGSFTSQRLQALLDAIRRINRDAYLALGEALRGELRDLAGYEVEFQRSLIQGRIGLDMVAPTSEQLRAITTWRPLGSQLLRELLGDLEKSKRDRIVQQIRLGMVQGEGIEEIIRRIRGTRAANYRDGILQISRASAERMVRTSVMHVANAAREEFYDANADLIRAVQWVATLDTRTCVRCMALDGRLYGLKKGPRPPLHINCRCTTVPVLRSWRAIGIAADELPAGTRASMNGQVSATLTFNAWLRRQSAAVQDEALGPTRGALFRRGQLSVDRFVDVRGNHLTLAQLAERERGAFRRAGVEA